MISRLLLLAVLSLFSLVANAQYAQHRDYVGGGFVRGDLNFVGEDFDLNALDLRLGVEMQKWLHVEGRVGFGLNDKAIGGVEISINRLLGVHAVASYPSNSLFRPYALVGFTYGEVHIRVPGVGSADESETDLSLGAGVDVKMSDGIDLFLEYMQYVDKGLIDLGGITLGLKFDF